MTQAVDRPEAEFDHQHRGHIASTLVGNGFAEDESTGSVREGDPAAHVPAWLVQSAGNEQQPEPDEKIHLSPVLHRTTKCVAMQPFPGLYSFRSWGHSMTDAIAEHGKAAESKGPFAVVGSPSARTACRGSAAFRPPESSRITVAPGPQARFTHPLVCVWEQAMSIQASRGRSTIK